MSPRELQLAALQALFAREGGHKAVAFKAGVSPAHLDQIVKGVKLPSGIERGLGRQTAEKLDKAYPGWQQAPQMGAPVVGLPVAQKMSHIKGNTPPVSLFEVPVIGTLSQGENSMLLLVPGASGVAVGFVDAPGAQPNSFAFRLIGDELYPVIRHGSSIIVSSTDKPVAGELVLAELDDGHYLLCEFVAMDTEFLSFLPGTGGPRRTMARSAVTALYPVTAVVPGSRFRPAAGC